MPKDRAFYLKKEIGWIRISDDQCPLVRHQTSNSRLRRLDIIRYRTKHRCPMSDVQCLMSDVQCPISEVWFPMFDARCLISEARCLISDTWCPICNVLCPISDVWYPLSAVRCPRFMSDIGTRFLVLVGEPLVWRNLGVFIFSHSFIN